MRLTETLCDGQRTPPSDGVFGRGAGALPVSYYFNDLKRQAIKDGTTQTFVRFTCLTPAQPPSSRISWATIPNGSARVRQSVSWSYPKTSLE